jgi:hypothetical protein
MFPVLGQDGRVLPTFTQEENSEKLEWVGIGLFLGDFRPQHGVAAFFAVKFDSACDDRGASLLLVAEGEQVVICRMDLEFSTGQANGGHELH